MSDLGTVSPESLSQLRQALSRYFDQSELHNLAFDLNVDFEELPGANKSDKARSLVTYMERRGGLMELVGMGRQLRPSAAWPEFPVHQTAGEALPGQPEQDSHHSGVSKAGNFSRYETGLDNLQAQLGQSHPRYGDFLVYQQRLMENITQVRRYGDTETRRAERAEIIDQLNTMALLVTGVSFNSYCKLL